MNGRIYDPKLGRMLQADPFIQAPKNSQSLNRYAYVQNNPLSYTDPSGYSLSRLWKKIRPFVAIAIAIWLPQLTVLWQAIGISSSIAIGGITGFVAGYVGSGNLNGALAGAFAGTAFGALHQWNAVSKVAKFGKSLAHGAVGGVQNLIQGAKFGHGFFSAGVTQSLAGPIGNIPDRTARILAAATMGDTVSQVTGGKFANGAVTAAFSRALNDEQLERELGKLTRIVQRSRQLADLSRQEFEILFEVSLVDDFELDIHVADLQQQLAADYLTTDRAALADAAREFIAEEYKSAALVGTSGLKRILIVRAISRATGLDVRHIRAFLRSQRVISEVKSIEPTLKGVAQGLLQGDERVREVFYGD